MLEALRVSNMFFVAKEKANLYHCGLNFR